MEAEVIDAWMQHPSREFLNHPMFDSLRRWSRGGLVSTELPLEWTLRAMDEDVARFNLAAACSSHRRTG